MLRATVLIVLVLGAAMAETPMPAPYMKGEPDVPLDAQNLGKHKTTSSTTAPTTAPTTTPTTAPTTAPTTKATTTVSPPTTTPHTTPPPTTTVPPPSTTPVPVEPPTKGKWAYVDKVTNVTCVIVQMAVQFNISYLDKQSKIRHAVFDLPGQNVTQQAGGSCGNVSEFITLQWPSSISNSSNNMTIKFMKNETDNKFTLTEMNFYIVMDSNFPDSNMNGTQMFYDHDPMFTISALKSYRCSKNQVITLQPTNAASNSTISIKDLQIQAFGTEKGSSFSYAEDCDYVDVPDIVPIAVGCALGGLVLVVLVTYLVGRRNRQARGYVSM